MSQQHEIQWLGPILDCSGYAGAARGYLLAAEAAGIRIRARDRSRSVNLRGKGMDEGVTALHERLSATKVSPDCPTVQHQVPDQFFHDRRSRLRIGYTIFEMCSIPPAWAPHCRKVDVIWTGSRYSRAAFLSGGAGVPVRVLPHAIDPAAFNDRAEPWAIERRRSFCFLSVFDFTERKAWRDLLRAYWTAFGSSDDVCLVLKCYFGSFTEQAIRNVCERISAYRDELGMGKRAPVLLYGHDVPHSRMAGLYRAADCFVGVSREGFGLCYAEAMSCGVACIGPEVGGNREFMTPENSFLARYLGDEKVGDETAFMYPTFAGLRWARHSWEHLSSLMRQVAEDAPLRGERARKGMEDVREKLSPAAVGGMMRDYLDRGAGDD
jgi:glycosyltransferase involved in cell wall biosynthesis